jgi:hypothetical protein
MKWAGSIALRSTLLFGNGYFPDVDAKTKISEKREQE